MFAADIYLLKVKNKHIHSQEGSEGSSAFHHSADPKWDMHYFYLNSQMHLRQRVENDFVTI